MKEPIAGGVKERSELEAARLRKTRALLGLQEVEVQIANSLKSALHKVRTYRDNARGYQTVVDFNQKLLEAQLARLEVGSIDSRAVLETEERFFEAKVNSVESLALFRKALLELDLVRGTMLQARNLDVTKTQLQARTADFLRTGKWSELALARLSADALRQLDPDKQTEEAAIQALRQKLEELRDNGSTGPLGTEPRGPALEEALRVLRREVERTRAKSP